MAFDTSIVGATGGNTVGDLLAFSDDWLHRLHYGTTLRIRDPVDQVYRYAVVMEVLSSRLCRVGWAGSPLPTSQPTVLWEESALSAVRGYPRSICVYQQRLVFGGFRDAGSLLAMSRIGQFRNFDLGEAKDDDAIMVVAAGGVRTIRHVVGHPQLTVLTENGVSYIPIDAAKPLTPSTVRYQPVSPHGAAHARPGAFDGGMLMVVDGGTAVRDISFSTEADNIQAEPVSLAATGFLGRIVDAAYLAGSNDRPEELAFFVTAGGRIVLFHSIRSQKVGAWFEWTTAGKWTAVCVAGQRVFGVVERIPGTFALEQFDLGCPFDGAQRHGPLAHPSHAPGPLPMPHLPVGATVHGADTAGDYLGEGVIQFGGGVQVTRQLGELADLGNGNPVIGLGYDWWIDPLPPAIDLADGTLLQRTQRLVRSALRLHRAQSARNGGERLVLRVSANWVEYPAPAASRWWTTTHLGWARRNEDGQVLTPRITRDLPLPVAVLALKREIKA